jgi:3-oxoacyl-ACP reductase-like protein
MWKSKTIWVNALTLCAGVVGYLVGDDLIKDNESLLALLIAVQGGVNVILRFVTTKPIV